MNGTLSPYLKAIAKQDLFDRETLEAVSALPTPQMQEQALQFYRQEKKNLMKQIVADMLAPPAAAPQPQRRPSTVVDKVMGSLFAAALIFGIGWCVKAAGLGIYHLGADVVMTVRGRTLPRPQITQGVYMGDHRVLMSWTPLGENYGYRLYYAYGGDDPKPLTGDKLVLTTQAIVNVVPGEDKEVYLTVAAVDRRTRVEGWRSPSLSMEPDARNTMTTVEPYACPNGATCWE